MEEYYMEFLNWYNDHNVMIIDHGVDLNIKLCSIGSWFIQNNSIDHINIDMNVANLEDIWFSFIQTHPNLIGDSIKPMNFVDLLKRYEILVEMCGKDKMELSLLCGIDTVYTDHKDKVTMDHNRYLYDSLRTTINPWFERSIKTDMSLWY